MKHSIMVGFSFGLTSGIITTLGLIVGLHSGTNSTKTIIGAILIIAIADAMSDALGVHIAEESENKHTHKEIWASTISTALSKFVFSSFFILPFLVFPMVTAILVSIGVGFLLISIFSYYLARSQKIKPVGVIGEHLLIASLVIFITHYVGECLSKVAN